MVPIPDLSLPILLSAVAVFLLSSIIHIVLKYHESDFKSIPEEDAIMDDLRKHNIPPGEYYFPRAKNSKDMRRPEFIEKMKKGPVAFITVLENAAPNMNKQLVQWFIYCIIIGIFAAYVAGRALPSSANYLEVFRFAGVTSFAGYGLALIQNSIWYKREWASTIKSLFDSLIYALFTAGIFGWLWPGPSVPSRPQVSSLRGEHIDITGFLLSFSWSFLSQINSRERL